MEISQIGLWVFGILVLSIIVFYALKKGYNVNFKKNNVEASFEKNESSSTSQKINVGQGVKIRNSNVGDISGIKVTTAKGVATEAFGESMDVLKNADIDGSEAGDITGIKTD